MSENATIQHYQTWKSIRHSENEAMEGYWEGKLKTRQWSTLLQEKHQCTIFSLLIKYKKKGRWVVGGERAFSRCRPSIHISSMKNLNSTADTVWHATEISDTGAETVSAPLDVCPCPC